MVLRAVSVTAVAFSAVLCFYAVVNVLLFGILGGFITYSLFQLIGNVRMLSSSVNAHLTLWNGLAMAGVPLVYVALVYATARFSSRARVSPRRMMLAHTAALAVVAGWIFVGNTPHERMGQPAGPADRRESALGPGLVLVRRNARRRHRPDDRSFPRCRSDRFRSAGRQAGRCRRMLAAGPLRRRDRQTKLRPAAKRDSRRAGIGRGAMDQPERPVRHHAASQGRVSARAGRRQFLCAHRPQLELAGGDTALALSQTRLPRRDRRIPAPAGHIARRRSFAIAGIAPRSSRRAI